MIVLILMYGEIYNNSSEILTISNMNTWINKVLKERIKEWLIVAIFPITFTITFIIVNYFLGWNFDWKEIDYLEQPAPLIRIFYSALAYISIGAILYGIGFYYWLHQIFWGFLWNYKLYKDIKKIVWMWNILIMYFIVVPWIIHLLNFIISLFFNSYNFFIQSLPLLGLAFGITWIILAWYTYLFKKEAPIIK